MLLGQNKRNLIINGRFDFWQRGTSLAAAASSRYLADRFRTQGNGSTVAPSQQAFVLGQSVVPNNPTYFHRTVVSSSAGANNYAVITQLIEDLTQFDGKVVSYSFWAKADAPKSIFLELVQNFGAGGSPSTQVPIPGATIALTTQWIRYTGKITLPALTGKTLGTSANTSNLQFILWLEAGTNFNSRLSNLPQQSGTFDVANIQLALGDSIGDFELAGGNTINEYQLCLRYYETTYFQQYISYAYSNVADMVTQPWRAQKRVTPTVLLASPSGLTQDRVSGTIYNYTVGYNGSSLSPQIVSTTVLGDAEF